MIRYLLSFFYVAVVAVIFSSVNVGLAVADVIYKECYALPMRTYMLEFKIENLLNPATAAPGDSVGSGVASETLSCARVVKFDFVLQVMPNAKAVSGNDVCETSVPGIGVRYLSKTGRRIPCNAWDEIAVLTKPAAGPLYPFLVKVFELVRTSEALPGPGVYNILLPGGQINSNWSGLTGGSGVWGSFKLTGDTTLVLSSCAVVNTVQTVSFGRLMKGDQAEKSFDIRFDQCGGVQALEDFKNYASIRFESSLLTPDGRLANSTCSTCATDTYIEVQDSSGATLNLANKIALTDSQVLGENTLIKSFKAILKPGKNQGAGNGASYLNFVIDYI